MDMKKVIGILLVISVTFSLHACGSSSNADDNNDLISKQSNGGIELVISTSYGEEHGNRQDFIKAYQAYEEASGNTIIDESSDSNEEWKSAIMKSFDEGSEPDVLFYFTGSDADSIIEEGKVVSIETIKESYPEYASNMKDSLLPVSLVDGKKYAIPVNGYWEGLYVNKSVLEESGVEVPGTQYTWDSFLSDCAKIKAAGYTPIATSLYEVPHYWFEFVIFNQGTVSNHRDIPLQGDDDVAIKWASGLDRLKELYDLGYLPEETLSAKDQDMVQLMLNNEAAFLIDGSWKISYFTENAEDVDNYAITYVPAENEREATDIIGGLSMGYYISEKAWNDETKRDAAVDFVMAMTTDDVVSIFSGATAVTALQNGVTVDADLSELEQSAIKMTSGATGVVSATQDGLSVEIRKELFDEIPDVMMGEITSLEAIEAAMNN